jgi:NAD+ kinase
VTGESLAERERHLARRVPPGARIEVRRGATPVRLVRLHEAPFTDRLVAKFGLPVEGWRGSTERRHRGGDA